MVIQPLETFFHYLVVWRKPHVVQRDQAVDPRGLNAGPAAVGFLVLQYPVHYLALGGPPERVNRKLLVQPQGPIQQVQRLGPSPTALGLG